MAQLSPKQYIKTKARSLPIYNCLVNRDWKEARLAQVMVLRRHVNGNVTSGIYLVDLLCLGIKNTFFYFNRPEDEVAEMFDALAEMNEETDYRLAHNIIYAGHDFALDYHIQPHPDFALTQFILEEDDDRIPLIEIEVGSEKDGKPHLIENHPGQYADALSKLKKYAGEGNYYYTVAADDDIWDDDEDDDDDDTGFDAFAEGIITPATVQEMKTNELLEAEKEETRTLPDRMTIRVELMLRLLQDRFPDYFENGNEAGFELIDDAKIYPSGGSMNTVMEWDLATGDLELALDELDEEESDSAANPLLIDTLNKYAHNPMVVTGIYESCFADGNKPVMQAARQHLEALAPQYPMATLSLALIALAAGQPDDRFVAIYEQPDPKKVFMPATEWNKPELILFWLIQLLVHTRRSNLKEAVHYYTLMADTERFNPLLLPVQLELTQLITEKLNLSGKEEKGA